MLVFGPLARRAEDLLPLMQILNIDDPDDPFDREIPLGDPAALQLKGLRVVMPVGAGITWGVSREMLAVRERAAAHLAAQGADIVRVKTGPLLRAQLIFIEALRSPGTTSSSTASAGRPSACGISTAACARVAAITPSPS